MKAAPDTRQVAVITSASQEISQGRVARGNLTPGSHGTERDSLLSLRSCHLDHQGCLTQAQWAKQPENCAMKRSQAARAFLWARSRRYFFRARSPRPGPGSDATLFVTTRQQRFGFTHLPGPHLTPPGAVSTPLTTTVFSQRSMW